MDTRKDECRIQAMEWAARVESSMPSAPDQRPELDHGWKAFCVEERARWLETHAMPTPVMFWSASACFDAYERWVTEWRAHIERVGDAWLARRGVRVAEWHSRRGEGLRFIPISQDDGPRRPTPAQDAQAEGPTRNQGPTNRATDDSGASGHRR